MLVAELNGTVVGYISARREIVNRPDGMADHVAPVDDIEVHPGHLRAGIGRMLLQKMRDRLAAEGTTQLRAVIWAFNTGSLTFFTKAGLTVQFHGVSQRLAPASTALPTPKSRQKPWWRHTLILMLGVYLALLIIERVQVLPQSR